MFLHVVAVRPLGGSALWLRFDDGAEGEVDLGPELEGPVFGPLRTPRSSPRPGSTRSCAQWRGRTGPTSRLSSCAACSGSARSPNVALP